MFQVLHLNRKREAILFYYEIKKDVLMNISFTMFQVSLIAILDLLHGLK